MSGKAETVKLETGLMIMPLAAEVSADHGQRLEGQKAAKKDNTATVGPLVLGLFMFCILVNCLIYIYQSSKIILAPGHMAEVKAQLMHDYTEKLKTVDLGAQPVIKPLPKDTTTWHQIAAGDDVDYLRASLRIAYATGASRAPIPWQNPATSHRGTVTLRAGANPTDPCRPFHITRFEKTYALSDNVTFCANGAIGQGGL